MPGSLVYIKDDGDKTKARDRYIVISSNDKDCTVQKITKSIRNVKYKLKLNEVSPVTPTINIHPDYLKGVETEDEDELDDTMDNTTSRNADDDVQFHPYDDRHVDNVVESRGYGDAVAECGSECRNSPTPMTEGSRNADDSTNNVNINYEQSPEVLPTPVHPRRSTRQKNRPKWLGDYQ